VSVAAPIAPAWPEVLPQYLSPTQLSLYAECPEKFRRRYVMHERTPSSGPLVLGSAVGKTIEHHLRLKIGEQPPDPLDDVFGQTLSDVVDNDEVIWRDDSYNSVQEQGLALIREWSKHVEPTIHPVDVERRIEYHVASLPIPIIGYIDIVEAGRTIENKTAGRKPNRGEPKPDWIIQGLVYRAASGLPHEWHVGMKVKQPYWLTPADEAASLLRVEWDENQRRLVDRIIGIRAQQIHAMYAMFGPDGPWPDGIDHERYGNSACSWCAYKPNCAWWGHERSAA
jgi:hypothetical protein